MVAKEARSFRFSGERFLEETLDALGEPSFTPRAAPPSTDPVV
jgi:hypothetical protein